jgi:acyl-homoserine lactone acylase PvdQ
MRITILLSLLFIVGTLFSQPFTPAEIQEWEEQAKTITIIRDDWGIPHIYGKTDADAVFGMLYAQCEDDFKRIEENYLDATGQMAPAYGEDHIYHDLRARMFLSRAQAEAYYRQSPAWLQQLCDAFAAGINYYLHTHPEVKPKYLTRFESWMPFTFSEGSIGGDITRISLRGLENFYADKRTGYIDTRWSLEEEPTGSNGFAISPEKSKSGHSLFLINPHTSFYFRSELQVNSEEGLKAYGAVTWGQFFIYQGFNEHCGWMHTSTYADAIDQYLETIIEKDGKLYYQYGKEERPVEEEKVAIPYRDGAVIKSREFTIYRTHHGPVIRAEGDKWVTFRMMNRPLDALIQSFMRTKAGGYKDFKKTMEIRTNSSNNTVYADSEGNIAYWHGNFIPKRDPSFDYNGLIDGSNPKADWGRLLKLKEMIHVRNPASGWIQNCNSTPFTVAGKEGSPDPKKYAEYIAPDRENFRGINAVRVLSSKDRYDLDGLIAAANDPYLAAFEKPIPALLTAYEEVGDKSDTELAKAIQVLKDWDLSYGEKSVGTSLAVFWAEHLLDLLRDKVDTDVWRSLMMDDIMVQHSSAEEKVEQLKAAMDQLKADFGKWNIGWGEINRFQRLTGNIQETYDDDQSSIPVGFTSSRWGSLAAYTARTYDTKKRYGSSGNSFVAVVEFGDRLQARAVVSGGQSGKPKSPHFKDQADLFCKGAFRPVYFYREEVEAHQEKNYRPGE